MKTVDFLDAVKAAYCLTSDYQLAKKLAVTHSSISHYRTGRNFMDNELCVRISELLELDALYVVACANIEREERLGNEYMVRFWFGVAQQGGIDPATLAITAA